MEFIVDKRFYPQIADMSAPDVHAVRGPSKLSKGTDFSAWTDKHLSLHLAGNFQKFEDSEHKGFVTLKTLIQIANDPAANKDDSNFARELLGRDDLMQKLDADASGLLDGKIDMQNVQNVIKRSVIRHSVAPPRLPGAITRL